MVVARLVLRVLPVVVVLVLVAGVMVWVSLAQLVPTALAFGGRRAGAAGFGAGVAVMAIGIALLS